MDIRKIAVVGGLAIGAALAFAPLASADGLTSTVDSEISSLNSQFEFDALLTGNSSDITTATAPNFDSIPVADIAAVQGNSATTTTASTPTAFDYLVYGFNPNAAGLSEDPTSGNVFNGAETKFDDAYNVFLYAAENKDALVPAGDLFGNHIADALQISPVTGVPDATPAEAFEYFYNFGIGDLGGFFHTDLSAFDITPQAATALFDLFAPAAM